MTRSSSQTAKWKCERLDRIIKLLNQMLPGVAKQTPAMTYPNLMTLSLTRGDLSQVDCSTFTFFCYLEVSICPFLSLILRRSRSFTVFVTDFLPFREHVTKNREQPGPSENQAILFLAWHVFVAALERLTVNYLTN